MEIEAITFTREWLTEHYKELARQWEENYSDEPDEGKYYSKERWDKASLKELCQELHQIIYDEQNYGIIALAEYFTQLAHKVDFEQVLAMFSSTTEHSH